MKKIFAGALILLVSVGFYACNKGVDYEKLRQQELDILEKYIDKNHPGAEATKSGLYYFNEEGTGSGDTIKLGDQVQIFYATWALYDVEDSVLADQSSGYLQGHRYEPYKVIPGSGGSIAGLEEALTYMQPGTHSKLVINSELAYGQTGSGIISMFTTVLMDIEVYKVIPLDTTSTN